MEEVRETKKEIRTAIQQRVQALTKEDLAKKTAQIEKRLFGFANYLESKIVLIYANREFEVNTHAIIKRSLGTDKILIFPMYSTEKAAVHLYRVGDFKSELKQGPEGMLKPNPTLCKEVPIECIDIAILPVVALDEKGSRIGSGNGYYDRLVPRLPITARKVALALEAQIIPQVPMESHDKHVDIIITEKRIIYKI